LVEGGFIRCRRGQCRGSDTPRKALEPLCAGAGLTVL
jgi:hypothetical protein